MSPKLIASKHIASSLCDGANQSVILGCGGEDGNFVMVCAEQSRLGCNNAILAVQSMHDPFVHKLTRIDSRLRLHRTIKSSGGLNLSLD